MRIVGPNCLGVFNSRNGAWLSFTSLFQERVAGPAIGMISQSGGSAAHLLKLAQARGLAVGTFITTGNAVDIERSEEHTSELQSLMRISYAVFCLKKQKNHT